MQERVPGWVPTSEADLSQVLIDLLAAAADELSDYQDRVVNEAYLTSARRRVSLARHARFMDYHIYQGNQASTWLIVYAKLATTGAAGFPPPAAPPAGLVAWTLPDALSGVPFASHQAQYIDPAVNELTLYTWTGAQPSLGSGDTSADLTKIGGGLLQAQAIAIAALFNGGQIRRLVIQQHLNPLTGQPVHVDPTKRQLLTIVDAPDAATVLHDELADQWLVRVRWVEPLLRD